MRKLFITKLILTIFTGIGLAGGFYRFACGLGASSNLSNAVPWGLWIGFDDMAGVALASGGFVITAIVYIFHLKRFRPILRSTICTAFLGYCLVPFSLLLDIGLPWNIWHPMIYWQYHSILFGVALCVMLVSTILMVGFAITVLEHPLFALPLFQKIYRFLNKYFLVCVVLGIIVSTLHQSWLGSLFLILPHRVHPLWYSPIIYVLYFLSAVGLGCSMIIVESTITSFLYGHSIENKLLQDLGRASSVVIFLYAIVRCADLAIRHKLSIAANGTWQSNLFLAEMIVSAILPIAIFNIKGLRSKRRWLFTAAVLVVGGFILNRLCTSFITIYKPEGTSYIPSLIEICTSLGLISAGALVFFYCVEHLNLFEGKFAHKPAHKVKIPVFSIPGLHDQFSALNHISRYTLAFILSVSFGMAVFYVTTSNERKYHTVQTVKSQASPDGKTLRITGGNNRLFVDFNHRFHQDTLGKNESCKKCHHMNIRQNEVSPCYICHGEMYKPTPLFNHAFHEAQFRDKGSCKVCHPRERTETTYRSCKDCHPTMFPNKPVGNPMQLNAPPYMDAMHSSCIQCHQTEWPKTGKPTPDYCNTCHKDMEGDIWKKKYGGPIKIETQDSVSGKAADISVKDIKR